MSRKFLAILSALLIAASLCACTGDGEEETTDNGKIDINGETGTSDEESEDETDEFGSEIGTGSAEIGDPGEYSYDERNETVYVNNPDSAVTLRSATYEAKGSVPHGTELKRTGLSTDGANYWSKVEYNDQEYYIASKFLTTLKDANEGFVDIEKTVVVNEQTGALNIRNLPTFDGSKVIGYANAGVPIKVIAENTETGWYKIEFEAYGGETAIGYIKSGKDNFVSEEGTETDGEPTTDAATSVSTEANSEASTEASTGK